MKRFSYKLATITQTEHWLVGNEIQAYEPYVREMRVWSDLFEQIEIFTPLTNKSKRGSLSTYDRQNINFNFVRYDTRIYTLAFLVRFLQMPLLFLRMLKFVWTNDVFLIRAPGHFSLVAHVLVTILRKKSVTKFAGFFGDFEGERIPSRVERFFIRNFLSDSNIVLVYGKHPQRHLISFFPLVLSYRELETIKALPIAAQKANFRFYSLGRLLSVKGFDLAINGLGLLAELQPDWSWTYHLIGDGPEQDNLRLLATKLGIADRVVFEGKQDYLSAMRLLKQADVVIMPGVMEGWPKVVAEAWAVSSIPLCANAGLLSEILTHGKNGFLFNPVAADFAKTCVEIRNLTEDKLQQIRQQGGREVEEITVEKFATGIESIITERLNLRPARV
jgi:glycosyltransferase involved in cell wall biosynthesis